jgi:hypothetical protein
MVTWMTREVLSHLIPNQSQTEVSLDSHLLEFDQCAPLVAKYKSIKADTSPGSSPKDKVDKADSTKVVEYTKNKMKTKEMVHQSDMAKNDCAILDCNESDMGHPTQYC